MEVVNNLLDSIVDIQTFGQLFQTNPTPSVLQNEAEQLYNTLIARFPTSLVDPLNLRTVDFFSTRTKATWRKINEAKRPNDYAQFFLKLAKRMIALYNRYGGSASAIAIAIAARRRTAGTLPGVNPLMIPPITETKAEEKVEGRAEEKGVTGTGIGEGRIYIIRPPKPPRRRARRNPRAEEKQSVRVRRGQGASPSVQSQQQPRSEPSEGAGPAGEVLLAGPEEIVEEPPEELPELPQEPQGERKAIERKRVSFNVVRADPNQLLGQYAQQINILRESFTNPNPAFPPFAAPVARSTFFPDYLRQLNVINPNVLMTPLPQLQDRCDLFFNLWQDEMKMERAWGHSIYQSRGYSPSYLCPSDARWINWE